jgi:hypothetical protein
MKKELRGARSKNKKKRIEIVNYNNTKERVFSAGIIFNINALQVTVNST